MHVQQYDCSLMQVLTTIPALNINTMIPQRPKRQGSATEVTLCSTIFFLSDKLGI